MPTPASTSGCKLLAVVKADGIDPLEVLGLVVVFAPLTAVLLAVLVGPDEAAADFFGAGGAVMVFSALGVGVVVHCHEPFA